MKASNGRRRWTRQCLEPPDPPSSHFLDGYLDDRGTSAYPVLVVGILWRVTVAVVAKEVEVVVAVVTEAVAEAVAVAVTVAVVIVMAAVIA